MAFLGGGAKASPAQQVTIPAPAPVRDDASVLGAAADERRRIAAQRGRASTVLGNAAAYLPGSDAKPAVTGVA
mgnify:CR=1 FL=1